MYYEFVLYDLFVLISLTTTLLRLAVCYVTYYVNLSGMLKFPTREIYKYPISCLLVNTRTLRLLTKLFIANKLVEMEVEFSKDNFFLPETKYECKLLTSL